jgi:Ni,Fe-hydrogenase III small subunit
MSQWVLSGLRHGIRTTAYPLRPDAQPGVNPGLPATTRTTPGRDAVVARCPTHALSRVDDRVVVDPRRCVHCMRCALGDDALPWDPDPEQARFAAGAGPLPRALARSLHVRVVDAGDCGACLREVRQLGNPYYNAHRLGFFFTPTPRQADILLVVGAGTDQTREALRKAYDAMPTPKRVIAVGACALSGGVFGPSFTCSAGIGEIVPVDIEVPGNPPPPLAILHALLLAAGRARSAR